MFKKIFIFFLIVCFVCLTTNVAAQELENQEGRVTSISIDEKAPYSGILLDSIAGAKFIAKSRYCAEELELRLNKQFEVKLTNKQLAIDLLQTQYDILNKTHNQLLAQKEKEINQLNEIIKDEIGDYSHWWFAGGVVMGIVLSIGIFYAAVEVQN
tara:strand:+ start:661 stop:1125 length:465 start_codon:yes stop_codon:yes gene_type:complete